MIRTWIAAGAVALVVGAGMVAPALAQNATPQPIAGVECSADQIPFERLTSVIASPVPQPTTADPAASPAPAGLPAGDPADDETTQAIRDSVQQITACLNAGDLLRSLSLYSDRFLNEAFGGSTVTQDQYDQEKANIQPRPEGSKVVLYTFSDVVILPDGRAVVSVLGDDLSSENPASATIFYFVNQDGAWLVDSTRDDTSNDSNN